MCPCMKGLVTGRDPINVIAGRVEVSAQEAIAKEALARFDSCRVGRWSC